MGWGAESHSRGNLEEVWALQEKQGSIAGRARGGGVDRHRNLPAHCRRSEARAPLVQVTVGRNYLHRL